MYFACWLALSAPPLTTLLPLSSLYNSLQKALKIPECSAWILRVIPGCVYYDCIGCWCRHWPLMTGDATLGAGVTTAARAEEATGSGHLDADTLGGGRWDVTSSLIIHFSADTRRSHIYTVFSACHQGLSLTISRRRNWRKRSWSLSPQCSKVSRQDSEKQQSTQRSTWHLEFR